MTTAELWPPLALIRHYLGNLGMGAADAAPLPAVPAGEVRAAPPAATSAAAASDHAALLLPLTELARRRQAVAQRDFRAHWAPGRLISVLHEGRQTGVLLDRRLGDERSQTGTGPERWQGWLVAAEADWAGAFDLLLEPQDEPFEPLFGVVQTWNPVTLVNAPALAARVQGELSATRLAAVRALADECAADAQAAQPGRIALRSVEGLSVLTGTPLAVRDDPRLDYQALYRAVARRLVAARPQEQAAAAGIAADAAALTRRVASGWGERLRGWLGLGPKSASGAGLWRPAVAVLALALVVQNVGLLLADRTDDGARLRTPAGMPTEPLAGAPDLRVRWRAGTGIEEATDLLRRADAQVMAGPDADGRWSLRLLHPEEGRRVLKSSALVEIE